MGAPRADVDIQRLQELGHPGDRDYRIGSPHLNHWSLYDRLSGLVRDAVAGAVGRGLPPTVLEIGAGHGGYTETALAAGAQVTATEMSRPSIERLRERYATNPALTVVFDGTGDLSVVDGERYSVVLCSSVLHHIPDYYGFVAGPVRDHLAEGGTLVTFQDPLWYPAVGPLTRRLDRWAHLTWRSVQGDYRRGLATMVRRVRRVYDEDEPADMVEYHVVRQGVDHIALSDLAAAHFARCSLSTYWSTAAPLLQRAGERLGRHNTFSLVAEGHRRDDLDR